MSDRILAGLFISLLCVSIFAGVYHMAYLSDSSVISLDALKNTQYESVTTTGKSAITVELYVPGN